MKRLLPILGLLVAVMIAAAVACWLTGRFVSDRHRLGSGDAHEWIHSQLQITDEQHAALEPIERSYLQQRWHCLELIRQANTELAQALLADRQPSPKVDEAVAKIHQAQGDLQKVTLQHVFEMKPVLKPGQYDKLLQLTADALTEVPHPR